MQHKVQDKFKVKFEGDWYSDTVFIKYIPLHSTEGRVKIHGEIYATRKNSGYD